MRYIIFGLFISIVVRICLFYFSQIHLSNGQSVSFSTTLLEDPKYVGNNQEFFVRFGSFWRSAKIEIVTNSDQEFMYGQEISIVGTLKEKSLKNKQAYFAIQNPQIEARNSGFLPFFGALRAKIINFCEKNFSQPYSGLLVGIIFGIKSQLTNEVTRSFRITGVAHVVAASGMNVTLVAGFLFAFFGSFLKRRLAIVSSIAGIFLYTCISGFDASIVRAAFMGSLAFSASYFGRQYSGLYMLFIVGSGMLLWDPLLLEDIGFQLSFLATSGILLLKPSLFNSFISDDLGTTLAAQIATLPILLFVFGQYSLLSILVNFLVLWTVPLITTIGGVGIFTGLIFAPLGKIIVLIIIPLVWYLVGITSFFATHSFIIQTTNVSYGFIIGYYLLVIACILFISQSKRKISIDKQ